MPRFVILTHDHPSLHWDFMLESGNALRTWRLLAKPDSGGSITGDALPDHRLDYLDYEGPVSGSRGSVARWDCGDFELLEESASRLSLRLQGMKLRGSVVLALRRAWMDRSSATGSASGDGGSAGNEEDTGKASGTPHDDRDVWSFQFTAD